MKRKQTTQNRVHNYVKYVDYVHNIIETRKYKNKTDTQVFNTQKCKDYRESEKW